MPGKERDINPTMRRILSFLESNPNKGTGEIARGACVTRATLSSAHYLTCLKDKGLIHISGWKPAVAGVQAPLYSIGEAPDCPRPAPVAAVGQKIPSPATSRTMTRIVDYLQAHPAASLMDIVRGAFVAKTTLACGYLSRMKREGHLHVSGWRRGGAGFCVPLYTAGPGEDRPRPRLDLTTLDRPLMDRIVEALKQRGEMTYREIADAIGTTANTLKNGKHLEALVAQKRIHIIEWRRRRSGSLTPVYFHGEWENAKKPKRLTSAEKSRRDRRHKPVSIPKPALHQITSWL
jgi:hypothetical protein